MDEKYYAHWSEDGRKQTVLAHLLCTALLCAQFAAKFGEKALGYWAGLLHDIGKFTQAFQKRLFYGGKKVPRYGRRLGEQSLSAHIPLHHGTPQRPAGLGRSDGQGEADLLWPDE